MAAVTVLHGAALWAAGSYRAPTALQPAAQALLTRTVEPPKLVDVEPPAPAPKVTPPATPIIPPAAPPKTPAKPAAQATAKPPAAAPSLPAAPPALAVLASPSGTAPAAATAAPPVAAPAALDAAPAVAKVAPAQAITQPSMPQPAATQLPSTDADQADTQYRIPLPAISTRLGEAGRVIVRVQVGLDGKALQVQLKTSSGFARLDENALATVARWRFKPGTRGGTPDVMWVEQPVNYAAQ